MWGTNSIISLIFVFEFLGLAMSVYQKISLFLLGSSDSNFSEEFLMSKKENFFHQRVGKKELFNHSFVSVNSVATVLQLEVVLQSDND